MFFDFHGGGSDHLPGRENEIAQSEATGKKPIVKYWLHNGFIAINSEKMSGPKTASWSRTSSNTRRCPALLPHFQPLPQPLGLQR